MVVNVENGDSTSGLRVEDDVSARSPLTYASVTSG